MSKGAATALAGALAVLPLAGCGTVGAQARPGTVQVTTGFYALTYAAEEVGGDHVTVHSLAKPGADAHDLELSPGDLVTVSRSRLVLLEKGFQPAVDDAVAAHAPAAGFDVAPAAGVAAGEEHAGEQDAHGEEDQHGHEDAVAHFWLDPVRYAGVVAAVGEQLSRVDPAHAADYRANAGRLVADLTRLDDDLRTGLAQCRSRELVTGHAAFVAFAERYDLDAASVAGLSAEAEPDARTLGELTGFVREHHVGTVFAEPLTSPALTRTLAAETGARVAVLDPVEGVGPDSPGTDYPSIMRANLATLRTALECR